MNKKDLIKDILTHLKENDEARERFNRIIRRDCVHHNITIIESINKVKIFYPNSDTLLLIHALSSPNGKPICGFLEEKIVPDLGTKIFTRNLATELRQIYLDELDKGESHDEAYKLINDKYNNLI